MYKKYRPTSSYEERKKNLLTKKTINRWLLFNFEIVLMAFCIIFVLVFSYWYDYIYIRACLC